MMNSKPVENGASYLYGKPQLNNMAPYSTVSRRDLKLWVPHSSVSLRGLRAVDPILLGESTGLETSGPHTPHGVNGPWNCESHTLQVVYGTWELWALYTSGTLRVLRAVCPIFLRESTGLEGCWLDTHQGVNLTWEQWAPYSSGCRRGMSEYVNIYF